MIKNNIIKKITALSVSCTLSVALLAGCGNSDNSQKDTTAKVSDKKSETATPAPDTSSPVSDVPAKKVYTVKSYNVYNEKNTLDHYYNFDYENNKLKKLKAMIKRDSASHTNPKLMLTTISLLFQVLTQKVQNQIIIK